MTLPQAPYTYLLGLYLGDGSIAAYPRDVFRLRIVCADAYPGLIRQCEVAMAEVRPNNPWSLSVARRGSVALLDDFVGPKR
jgi:hypothetical protein